MVMLLVLRLVRESIESNQHRAGVATCLGWKWAFHLGCRGF